MPIIEWIQEKMKKKRIKSSVSDIKIYDRSITPYEASSKKVSNAFDISEKLKSDSEEFDPFKRTGCLFGCLFNEIKYRYSKYLSDIKDGLNLHCLIAFVFIFTVCVAPAFSFGGILGKICNTNLLI
jgi:hypothetical protein